MSQGPRVRLWHYVAAIGCLCMLGLDNGAGTPRTRAPRMTTPEEEMKAKRINAQLDEILKVQDAILQRFDELMAELQAVKVRASQ